ncbi:MAG: murein biosynthesis integral membrane protein MurJ [Candidatus Falkowbacteria bacterium]
MIKKIFTQKIDSVAVAAFLVAGSSLLSRLLGVFRDRILAGQFGAGNDLDIYYAAFRIPDLIFNLVVLGALSAGFIPIFTSLIGDEEKPEHQQEAWSLTNNVINIIGVGLIILGVVGFFGAPLFIHWITPGFIGDKLTATVNMSRIMFLSPFLLGLSSIIGGVLQSYKRFFTYSLSPVFYNFGIIIGALYLVQYFGIYGLAWGVVLGSLLHLLVQLPVVFGLGFRYRWSFAWREARVASIFRMMTGRTASLVVNQLNLVANTIIASLLVSGSLTIFNLANNLQAFPVGVFGISFAIAVFPTLAVHAFNRKKLVEVFSQTLRRIMFFIVPATGLFFALRAQLVRAALGSGRFSWEDTNLTIATLAAFVFSFFAQASIPLLSRMYYARHDSKTPFYIGLSTMVFDIGLAWWLGHGVINYHVNPMVFTPNDFYHWWLWLNAGHGVVGLAVAFSISSSLNFLWLWLNLRREVGSLDELMIVKAVAKFAGATILALMVVQLIKDWIEPMVDMNRFWGIITQGGIAGLAGLVVYLLFCWLFKSEEMMDFSRSLVNRLPFKKIKPGDQGEARGI